MHPQTDSTKTTSEIYAVRLSDKNAVEALDAINEGQCGRSAVSELWTDFTNFIDGK